MMGVVVVVGRGGWWVGTKGGIGESERPPPGIGDSGEKEPTLLPASLARDVIFLTKIFGS
jgi:hypothetical protein